MSNCVNLFQYASSIRMPGEDWRATIKRASAEVRRKNLKFCAPKASKTVKPRAKVSRGRTKSECFGLSQEECVDACGWIKEAKTKKGQVRKAHCGLKKVGAKTAKSVAQAWEKAFQRK